MKVYCFILLCLSSCIWNLKAQELHIFVFDALDNSPLPGAIVRLNGQIEGSTSLDGQFSIAPSYPAQLEINLTGYQGAVRHLEVHQDTLNVVLTEDSKLMQAVVVSASKYEQDLNQLTISAQVISSQAMEDQNLRDASEALARTSGVQISDKQISIRGGSGYAYGVGSRTLLLFDDMPYLTADAGSAKWNALPMENVEQIEVLKGASSVLYGSAALNGVVHFRSAESKNNKPFSQIRILTGVYDKPKRLSNRWDTGANFMHNVSFVHREKRNKWGRSFYGNWYQNQGYRAGEEEERFRFGTTWQRNWGSRDQGKLMLSTHAQQADEGIFLLWHNKDSVYLPMGGTDPNTTTLSFNESFRWNIDPTVTYQTKNGNQHKVQGRYYLTQNKDHQNRNSNAQLFYLNYQYLIQFGQFWNLTLGLNETYNHVKSELYGDRQSNMAAAYAQINLDWKKLHVTGGFRQEQITLLEEGSSPSYNVMRLGANYELGEYTFLRGSAGQGYRYPSIAEKYVRTSVSPLNVFPNPELNPEKGWSAELGIRQLVKWKKWKAFVDLSVFHQEYEDMMEFTFGNFIPDSIPVSFLPDNPGYFLDWVGFRSENVEQAVIQGAEINLGLQYQTGKTRIQLSGGYTRLNPKSVAQDSAYVQSLAFPDNPYLKYRNLHLFSVNGDLNYEQFSIGFTLRGQSKMENLDRSFLELEVPIGTGSLNIGDALLPGYAEYLEEYNKGFVSTDVRCGYTFKRNTRASLVVQNLQNIEISDRPGNVLPPRTFLIQFTQQLK